jgi:hypothetical protein
METKDLSPDKLLAREVMIDSSGEQFELKN